MKRETQSAVAGACQPQDSMHHFNSLTEIASLARVKWTREELLAAKARQQSIVDHYANQGHDLTPREHAALLLALRTIRTIGKHLARRRSVVAIKRKSHPR